MSKHDAGDDEDEILTGGRQRRFFVPEQELVTGIVELTGEEARHAAGALRMKPGDPLFVFDGTGRFAAATICSIQKKSVSVTVSAIETEPPVRPHLTIATAIPKGKRLQVLVEKCTELGAGALTFLQTERSVVTGGAESEKRERWAVEACKQCRRWRMPSISGTLTLEEFLAQSAGMTSDALKLIAHPGGVSLGSLQPSLIKQNAVVLIGPEGGFTDEETERCQAQGYSLLSLGRTILRTETACIAVAAAHALLTGEA